MKENLEKPKTEYFKYPDIEKEEGEFMRVAEQFGIESSSLMFLAQGYWSVLLYSYEMA